MSEDATDPGRERRLYAVATVHLDTQWRWTVQETIRRHLPATLAGNFAHLERHPWFVLSFEGAFRYRLVEEYHPRDFERLRDWARQGRWHPAGAMLEAPDVNLPAPESLLRHILYGQRFFRARLGVESADLFLPDCFGFGWALPTIAAHCGLRGFSTSKLVKWRAPAGIPFDLGLWEGPDGGTLLAALRPEGYGEGLAEDLSTSERLLERLDRLGEETGLRVGMKYVGLGDRGGALDEAALAWLGRSLAGDGPITVVLAGSDRLCREVAPREAARLPRHRGELLLPTHGTGCWTSQAAAKRWNRRCERLADAAERAAAAAAWLGALPYPAEALREAWERFLWHQMHDDLTGTSVPQAYRFTWNDQLVALRTFEGVLTDAVAAVASGLDTSGDGIPVVVFNPLAHRRRELVEASLTGVPEPCLAIGPEGEEAPVQILAREGERTRLLFAAELPGHGFAVYRIVAGEAPPAASSVAARARRLESERHRVVLDAAGRLESLFDRLLGRELLAAPAGLQLLPDRSRRWPAWEIRYEDLRPGRERALDGPAEIALVESGPLRAALEVRRRAAGSRLAQRFVLAAEGEWMAIETRVDWRTRGRLLKLAFPLVPAPPAATYDLRCGAIERGTNAPAQHEVPAQQWADLSTEELGVSVLSASTYGWDRPVPGLLRATLLRAPAAGRRFRHQAVQDHGSHSFRHALYGHEGDWREGGTPAAAARFEQPLLAFAATPHAGPLGRRFALLGVRGEGVEVRALKRAEDGDELVVRLQEAHGRTARRVRLSLPTPLAGAHRGDGRERPHVQLPPEDGDLVLDFLPFELRTILLAPQAPGRPLTPPAGRPLPLPFDRRATSRHGERPTDFDGAGRSYPGELWPGAVEVAGLELPLGPAGAGALNALAAAGQTLAWEEPALRLLLLAASAGPDLDTEIRIGDRLVPWRVQRWTGPIGCFKGWRRGLRQRRWGRPGSGFLKRDAVAWVATHRHDRRLRDEPHELCYLFRYEFDLEPGERRLVLPREPRLRLFAAAVVLQGPPPVTPAWAERM